MSTRIVLICSTGSPILSFPVPLASMSRPLWVEVEEKEQVVFVTVYKQTVFVGFDWFDRTPIGRDIYSVRPTFDAGQKRYQARLSYQSMTDRRFMLMTSEGAVSMTVVP